MYKHPVTALVSRSFFFVRIRLFALLSFVLLDNRSSGHARAWLLRRQGATIGRGCIVRGGFQAQESFQLTLGDDCYINSNCCFDLSAPVTIGRNVHIAFQTTFVTGGHHIGPSELRAGQHDPAPITVGDGAWIGARAIIMPGVTIGAGAVVAAGAIVTRDVDPDTLVAGAPAREIRKLEPGGLRNNTDANPLAMMFFRNLRGGSLKQAPDSQAD